MSHEIQRHHPTAADVLRRYNDEDLPDFCGMVLTDVNQCGLFGSFPLAIAATRGDIDDIRALLEGGAYINAVGEHGYTALHDAVAQGNEAAVKALVEWGAAPYVQNDLEIRRSTLRGGRTALSFWLYSNAHRSTSDGTLLAINRLHASNPERRDYLCEGLFSPTIVELSRNSAYSAGAVVSSTVVAVDTRNH